MRTFDGTEDLSGARFERTRLRGARFVACDLTGVVMRGVDVNDADIDAPWLIESGASLLVNGVDVAPFVDAELNRRFPGRELRRATDPAGLREAWTAVERTWGATLERVAAMPPGTVDVSVDGEWSFAQTLRHLVLCTDGWLRWGAQGRRGDVFWPAGMPHSQFTADAPGMIGTDPDATPSYEEVLEVRRERVREVRDFLAGLTPEEAGSAAEPPPWMDQSEPFTVGQCVWVVLDEEWEHHQFATRDLDLIEAGAAASA